MVLRITWESQVQKQIKIITKHFVIIAFVIAFIITLKVKQLQSFAIKIFSQINTIIKIKSIAGQMLFYYASLLQIQFLYVIAKWFGIQKSDVFVQILQ